MLKLWMRLRYTILPLLFVLPVQTSSAQTDSVQQQHLLWQISGNKLSAPSYLFGTIHSICPDDFFLPAGLEKAFKKSAQLVLEIDLDDPAMTAGLQSQLFMNNNGQIPSLLPDSSYRKLKQFFSDSLQLNLSLYDRMRPLLLAGMVSEKLLRCSTTSYEMEFLGMARKQKKETLGLETAAAQLAAIDTVPYQRQAQMLLDLVSDFQSSRSEFLEMVKAYKAQNLYLLYKQVAASDNGFDAYDGALLDARNARWLPEIKEMIGKKSSFIAVGAGHLGGEKGLIALLRNEGYTVEAVTK